MKLIKFVFIFAFIFIISSANLVRADFWDFLFGSSCICHDPPGAEGDYVCGDDFTSPKVWRCENNVWPRSDNWEYDYSCAASKICIQENKGSCGSQEVDCKYCNDYCKDKGYNNGLCELPIDSEDDNEYRFWYNDYCYWSRDTQNKICGDGRYCKCYYDEPCSKEEYCTDSGCEEPTPTTFPPEKICDEKCKDLGSDYIGKCLEESPLSFWENDICYWGRWTQSEKYDCFPNEYCRCYYHAECDENDCTSNGCVSSGADIKIIGDVCLNLDSSQGDIFKIKIQVKNEGSASGKLTLGVDIHNPDVKRVVCTQTKDEPSTSCKSDSEKDVFWTIAEFSNCNDKELESSKTIICGSNDIKIDSDAKVGDYKLTAVVWKGEPGNSDKWDGPKYGTFKIESGVITDEPCDDEGDWQLKEEIYCFEDDTKKGFCLDDSTYQSNKDHIEVIKEGTNTHCVKCKDDDCCHDVRSLCFDYKSTSSTGCTWSPGTLSSSCSDAGGDTCDEKSNLASCTLKESQGKIGLIYCALCNQPTTTPPTTAPPTTPPTTAPPTTPPTTAPPTTIPHELTCNTPISVGENIVCTLTDCTKGLWILTNKEGNPLSYPIVTEMPPSENAELGTTEEEGKILVRALCTQYDIPSMNSYEVEVKKGVSLTCPEECEVDKECECVVEECTLGLFKAENEEDEPLEKNIAEAISESPYEYTFTTKEAGEVKAIVTCIDPDVTKEQIIEIIGEVEEEFEMKSVECNKNECTIEIDKNTMEDDITIIINLFDEPDGTIFYSAQEDIDAEKTGDIEIDLEKIKTCPSGKDIKVIVLAYKADNLNKLLDRLKEDAFEC